MFRQEPHLLPAPFGLNNSSGICWFNALIQGVLTCTALIPTGEPVGAGQILWNRLAEQVRSGNETGIQTAVDQLLNEFLRQFSDKSGLRMGPSCAAEGVTHLIDFIGIGDRVKTSQKSTIQCDSCGASVTSERQDGSIVYLSGLDLQTHFRSALVKSEHACLDYSCQGCGKIGKCIRRETLCYISSVVIVSIPDRSGVIPARILQFGSSIGALLYRLVSIVLHDGGHYWTICLRQKGGTSSAFLLNDSGVTPLETVGDEHMRRTYLAFYVLIGRNDESPIRPGSTLPRY